MSIAAVQFIAAVRKYLDEKVGFRDNYCAGGAGVICPVFLLDAHGVDQPLFSPRLISKGAPILISTH